MNSSGMGKQREIDVLGINQKLQVLQRENPEILTLEIVDTSDWMPVYKLTVRSQSSLKRKVRVFVSSGVHGNEPEAVRVALHWLERVLENPRLLEQLEIVMIPMVNPGGLSRFLRTTFIDKLDLNRTFQLHVEQHWDPESESPHHGSIAQKIMTNPRDENFDLAVDLHGSIYATGFFIVGSKESLDLAKRVVDQMDVVWFAVPPDGKFPGKIGTVNDPNRYEVLSPGISVSSNSGTLRQFHQEHLRTPYSSTLEYPQRLESSVGRHAILLEILENIVGQVLVEKLGP